MATVPVAEASALIDSPRRAALWREPRAATLVEIVSHPASHFPDLPALYLSTDGRTAEPLSWADIWSGALGLAAQLTQSGLGRDEPVLLAVPTSAAFFTAFFGVLAAGGVPAPIATPPSLNPARLEWYRELVSGIADDAGARCLITTSRFREVLSSIAAAATHPLQLIDASVAAESLNFDSFVSPAPSDFALLQYTSGSTSQPKGVPLTHANVVANASIIAEAIAFERSACVSWLPLHHDMGLIGAALTGLYSRTPILLLPTTLFVKEPASWLRAIGAFRATITLAPNFAFSHAVRHAPVDQLAGLSLASLRTALNGAEPVDIAAVEAFESAFAPLELRRGVVRPVYGLAESALAVTFSDEGERLVDVVDAAALENERRAMPAPSATRTRRFVSVGRPLPTQQVRIVDEHGSQIADRTVGEVTVSGPSIMHGYYRRPDDTARTIQGGWLHTGDLGYLADGRLYLTGRLKDLIIRHGRNYHPPDIELVIAGTEGVSRGGSVAFSLPGVEEPQVVVVAETRIRQADELDALTRRILARCHDAFLFGPDRVCLVPPGGIPRTTSGKVRRQVCRQLYVSAELPLVDPRVRADR